MAFTYKLIKKAHHKTTTWAGGSTTELAIYPPRSSYKLRNFSWRLSTASVEQNETVFTSLPGYKRILMVLEGAMVLAHEQKYIANLAAYGKDSFDGGWTTHCVGTGRDFNVMLGEGCDGSADIISDNGGHDIAAPEDGTCRFTAFYCADAVKTVKSTLTVGPKDYFITLAPGDLLLIEDSGDMQEAASIQFTTLARSSPFHIVHAEIACKV